MTKADVAILLWLFDAFMAGVILRPMVFRIMDAVIGPFVRQRDRP